MPNNPPQDVVYEVYQKAADRFVNDVNKRARFFLNFHIGLFIFLLIVLLIAMFVININNYQLAFSEIFGTGCVFSIITLYSLIQIKSCWQCSNCCGIAIFHLDIKEHQKAFEFMKESECLKANVNVLKQLIPAHAE